ncbi:MAG: flagellar basal body rod protein FlgB [Candidatus Lernaella stagnicola]|nr:flagellar basal body rod protein FlgB [Candidatus Lernaella stagnicola]
MGIESFLFSDPTSALLKRSLDIHSHRVDLIAGNLANADTPGYKARDLDFRAALQDAAEQTTMNPGHLARTHPQHLDRGDLAMEIEEQDQAEDGSIRVDGNTVNTDKELQKMAESQLMYNATITALARKMKMINQALAGKI